MKIKLYRKAPKCPKCKVPMKFEEMTYTDKQQKMIDCKEHDWKQIDNPTEKSKVVHFECLKCGETLAKQRLNAYDETGKEEELFETLGHIHIPIAELYRCPKCLNLYKVQG